MNIRSTISLRWYHCFHGTDFSWTTAEIALILSASAKMNLLPGSAMFIFSQTFRNYTDNYINII